MPREGRLFHREGESILTLILAVWLSVAYHNPGQVAGVTSENDSNHPVEVYFGPATDLTLQEMADDLAVTIYPEDKVSTFPDPSLGMGSKITIARATPVLIIDAKNPKLYHTWETTVGGLLKEKGIALLGQDSIVPNLGTAISFNLEVQITRVAEVEVVEKEPIAFKTIKEYDDTLEKGNKKISQKGIDGEKAVTYLVKRVDGIEVYRTVLGSEITKETQDEIIIIGTKVTIYGTGKATWYSRNATMVAASNTIPKGTLVRVVAIATGKSVVVEIDDSGIQSGAIIDLSDDAFAALAPLGAGVINVRVEKYYPS